jgi:hypothetical protein
VVSRPQSAMIIANRAMVALPVTGTLAATTGPLSP